MLLLGSNNSSAQFIQSLPNAISTMLDPAATAVLPIGLPQDVQGWTYGTPILDVPERKSSYSKAKPDIKEINDASDDISKQQKDQ